MSSAAPGAAGAALLSKSRGEFPELPPQAGRRARNSPPAVPSETFCSALRNSVCERFAHSSPRKPQLLTLGFPLNLQRTRKIFPNAAPGAGLLVGFFPYFPRTSSRRLIHFVFPLESLLGSSRFILLDKSTKFSHFFSFFSVFGAKCHRSHLAT